MDYKDNAYICMLSVSSIEEPLHTLYPVVFMMHIELFSSIFRVHTNIVDKDKYSISLVFFVCT